MIQLKLNLKPRNRIRYNEEDTITAEELVMSESTIKKTLHPEIKKPTPRFRSKRYKIQEVIKPIK